MNSPDGKSHIDTKTCSKDKCPLNDMSAIFLQSSPHLYGMRGTTDDSTIDSIDSIF